MYISFLRENNLPSFHSLINRYLANQYVADDLPAPLFAKVHHVGICDDSGRIYLRIHAVSDIEYIDLCRFLLNLNIGFVDTLSGFPGGSFGYDSIFQIQTTVAA